MKSIQEIERMSLEDLERIASDERIEVPNGFTQSRQLALHMLGLEHFCIVRQHCMVEKLTSVLCGRLHRIFTGEVAGFGF